MSRWSSAIKTLITKGGGVGEELDMKLNKVPLYAHSGQVIQAVGIPQISEELAKVDMSHISRVLDIQQTSLIEGRPDRSVNWHQLFFFPC